MSSKGYSEATSVLRGRSFATYEAKYLKFLVDIATETVPKMNQPTHIIVATMKVTVANPHYTSYTSEIEPRTIEEIKQSVTHFYSEKEFKDFLSRNPGMLNSSSYAFYKVAQLFPKITTTVTIDV